MVASEAFDQVTDIDDLSGVETRCGFIENDRGWVVNECLSNANSLPEAFGKFAD
jgi:hypothetical protein